MNWQDPSWLWYLFLVGLFTLWSFWDLRKRESNLRKLISADLWSKMLPGLDWARPRRKALFVGLALAMIVIALARPRFGKTEELVSVSGLDMVIALDLSRSMEVEDVVPNRIKKAKYFIRKLVQRLPGDRVGLVVFAGSSYLQSPLTSDQSYFLDVLATVNTNYISNQGTDLGLALETAVAALERGAEDLSKNEDERAPPSKAILLITDGEEFEGLGLKTTKKVQELGARLYIVGVGTEKGGPIPIRNSNGYLQGYKRDSKNKPVLSRLKADHLKKISNEADGRYWTASDSEIEIEQILADLGALDRTAYAQRKIVRYEERFYIPVLIALIFLFADLFTGARRPATRKDRLPRESARSSVGARAGSLAGLIVLAGLTVSEDVHAIDSIDVYLQNKKGLEAFEKGKTFEAEKHFGKAQALDPDKSELMFNQGVVSFEKQDYEEAIRQFDRAAQEARTKKGEENKELLGKSLYNLGEAFAQNDQIEESMLSYLQALDHYKADGNKEMEENVRKKLMRMAQEQQKKQQQQQGKGKGDEGEQKQSKDGKGQAGDKESNAQNNDGEGREKDDEEKEKGSSKPNYADNKQNQNQKFQSKGLRREDAERVMDELADRERNIMKKLNRKKAQRKRKSEFDW